MMPRIRVNEIYEILNNWEVGGDSSCSYITDAIPAIKPGAKFEVLEINDSNGTSQGVTMMKDLETGSVYTIDVDIQNFWCFFNNYDLEGARETVRRVGQQMPPMEIRLVNAVEIAAHGLKKQVESSLKTHSRDEIQQALATAERLRQNLGSLENYLITNLRGSK